MTGPCCPDCAATRRIVVREVDGEWWACDQCGRIDLVSYDEDRGSA